MGGVFRVNHALRARINGFAFKAAVTSRILQVPTLFDMGAAAIGVAGRLLIKDYQSGATRVAADALYRLHMRQSIDFVGFRISCGGQIRVEEHIAAACIGLDIGRLVEKDGPLAYVNSRQRRYDYTMAGFLKRMRLGLNYDKGLAEEGICSGRTFITWWGETFKPSTQQIGRKAVSGDDAKVRKEENLAAHDGSTVQDKDDKIV